MNRRNYGDSPVYLNPLGFLAGNPATLVVGGSDEFSQGAGSELRRMVS